MSRTITSPDEWREVAPTLEPGDQLVMENTRWKVIAQDGVEVELKPVYDLDRDIITVGPASGKLGKVVSTRESGIAARYGDIEVLEG